MDIKQYEKEEAKNWLEGKDKWDGLELLAEYGRRLYNQAINDAVGVVENTQETSSIGLQKYLIERIKKLER